MGDKVQNKVSVVLAALAVGSNVPASRCVVDARRKAQWRQLVLIRSSFVALLWLVTAYAGNDRVGFHLALLILIAVCILCHLWFRLPGPAILAANTLMLPCVALPLVDLCRSGSGYTGSDPRDVLRQDLAPGQSAEQLEAKSPNVNRLTIRINLAFSLGH